MTTREVEYLVAESQLGASCWNEWQHLEVRRVEE